ncbi:MAG: hypothetical protein AB8F74_12905 [Saprospiraceae bacterium]
MKFLFLIWTLMVVALSIAPCYDGHDCVTVFDEEHHHDHDQNPVHDEDGPCSPFCPNHGSIVGPDLPPATEQVASYDEINLEQNAILCFEYRYQFLGGIWHPPALV